MYSLDIKSGIDRKLSKISKKDKKLFNAIANKLEEVRTNPHHYKPLRKPMQHLRRIHILGSFVLIFSIDETEKIIILQDIAHHDDAYH